jgi:NADPH:quinone reductase-like Zn-dependent oxidoreductase
MHNTLFCSGGVGSAACQIAKDHGLYIIGSAGSEEGEKAVKACGAGDVCSYSFLSLNIYFNLHVLSHNLYR